MKTFKWTNWVAYSLWIVAIVVALLYGTGTWADESGGDGCHWSGEDNHTAPPPEDRIFANGFEDYCDDDDGDDD